MNGISTARGRMAWRRAGMALTWTAGSLLWAGSAWSATITVSNATDLVNGDTSSVANLQATDGGDGISLREAILAANTDNLADAIVFTAGLSGSTITLTGGNLQVEWNLTVTGPGPELLAIDGNGGSIFSFNGANAAKVFAITSLTLTNAVNVINLAGSGDDQITVTDVVARDNSDPNISGSVMVASFAQFNLVDSAIVRNAHGIGLDLSSANGNIRNSTFSNNSGAAISIFAGTGTGTTTLMLRSLTLANNNGAGVAIRTVPTGRTLVIDYATSIFANNSSSFSPPSTVAGTLTFTSNGRNLLTDTPAHPGAPTDLRNVDPRLYPLAEVNGTFVRPLRYTSPAIDTVPLADAPTLDQRGAARFDGNFNAVVSADMGAYELADPLPPAPVFSKQYVPDTVLLPATTTLIFTIDNSGSTFAAAGVSFSDAFPAGTVVATPAAASTTCNGGTLTANPGAPSISYNGGGVAAGASCTISVNVRPTAAGVFVNTSGNLTSDFGNSGPATDTLTVNHVAPVNQTNCATIGVVNIGSPATVTLAGNVGVTGFEVIYNGTTVSGLPAGAFMTPNTIVGNQTSLVTRAYGVDPSNNVIFDEVVCPLDYSNPTTICTQSPDSTVTPVGVGTVITLTQTTTNAVAATADGSPMTPTTGNPNSDFTTEWERSYVAVVSTTVNGLATGADSDTASCNWAIDVARQLGVVVSPTAGLTTTEAGGTASFTVVLSPDPPLDDVTIALSSSQTAEATVSPASLTFTPANYDTPQLVTVTGVNDDIDDGDMGLTIITGPTVSPGDPEFAGIDPDDVSVTNLDDDTAGITVTPTAGLTTSEAGGTDSFSVVLDSEPTADVSIGISSSDATEGTPDVATLTFTAGNWDTPQAVTVTGVDDAVVDGDQGYTIVTAAAVSADAVYAGMNPADVTVTNSDDDTAGLQIDDVSVLEGTGGNTTATFSVSLDTAVDGGFSVDYSSADASATAPADYLAVSGTLNFVGMLGETQTIAVTVIGDGDLESDETYLINLAAPSNAAVGLTDGSGLGTIVNDDGADLSVALAATPDPVTAGLTLVYTASVSNDGPANGDAAIVSLTLPAGASFVSGTVSGGGSCAGAGPVLCNFSGPVLPGAANARSAVVNVAIAASQLGTLTGTAVVSAGTADPDPANNSSSITTAAAAAADLSLALSIDPPAVAVGEFFTLTAVASNNGPSDAVNARIDIDVPPGALLVGSTPSTGGLCASAPVGASVQVSCDYAGATVPGTSRSVAVLLQAVAPGQIELPGVVASDTADPQPGNQSAVVTLGAAAVPIPTLQPTALLALLLTLMGLGAGYLRRR